jgi:CubicO group peptidase (beta-lactamase class C family)
MKQKPLRFLALIACCVILLISSCKIGRFVIYNFADIKDYKKFPSRPLTSPANKFEFNTTEHGKFPKTLNIGEKQTKFETFLAEHKTVAFLIIKNDTIQYEQYFAGYDKTSIVPSFSMAKSITSMLIGCAIDDKLIQSVQQPVTDFIPELKKNGFDKVSIENLLQMTSGLKFNEGYTNPFGAVANFYYGRNLRKALRKMKLESAPGLKFEYKSGNTELLGLVLERALKNKTITQYFQEKLWTPLGMEFDASWSLDKKKNGLEKTFCCINARARDFAKLGRLYLNKGNWNGNQIVSKSWVEQSTKVDTSNGSAWYYQYQWWLPSKDGDFLANGILGQYVYVNPAKHIIMVRLGKSEGKVDWPDIFVTIAKGY